MRLMSLLTMFLFFSNFLYAGDFVGNGNVITENRNVKNFEDVTISGQFDLAISKGDKFTLELIGDSNILQLVKTQVDGEVLKIHTTENISTKEGLLVNITMPKVEKLTQHGNVSTTITGFKLKKLKVETNGAGSLKGSTEVEDLELKMRGAGKADLLTYKLEKVDLEVGGAAEILLPALKELKGKVSGAVQVSHGGVSGRLELDNYGSSSVKKR